jgi:hypothetical protein
MGFLIGCCFICFGTLYSSSSNLRVLCYWRWNSCGGTHDKIGRLVSDRMRWVRVSVFFVFANCALPKSKTTKLACRVIDSAQYCIVQQAIPVPPVLCVTPGVFGLTDFDWPACRRQGQQGKWSRGLHSASEVQYSDCAVKVANTISRFILAQIRKT